MSMGFLCICVYDLHLKKVNIKENCKWSIYAPHMSELPHLNFHFEFVINLIYSINQTNQYGSYDEDTLGLFSIRFIFPPINLYSLYMRYYEKWSEIAHHRLYESQNTLVTTKDINRLTWLFGVINPW